MVKDGALNLDFEDEVTKSTVITHGGAVVSDAVKKLLEPAAAGRWRTRVSDELAHLAGASSSLAILVGFEVISKVPATLHTPLMSGANSIHGIVLVGAMLIAAEADNPLSYILALRRDGVRGDERRRRLRRDRPDAPDVPQEADARQGRPPRAPTAHRAPDEERADVAAVDRHPRLPRLAGRGCRFVFGLHRMNSPATARNGNLLSARPAWSSRSPRPPSDLAEPSTAACSATAWAIIVVGVADRRRGRPVYGPDREDDRDAAAGVAVQRDGRRRGGTGRDR